MKSMTGIGISSLEVEGVSYICEISSVNKRFLELSVNSCLNSSQESEVRKIIKADVSRGKVYCLIAKEDQKNESSESILLLKKVNALASELNLDTVKNIVELFSLGKLLVNDTCPLDMKYVRQLVTRALLSFNEMKVSEGKELVGFFNLNLSAIQNYIEKLKPLVGIQKKDTTQAIKKKLSDAGISEYDEQRVYAEIALIIEKLDIEEELTRLSSHVSQCTNIVLNATEPVGKKLDFLLQEMLREVNTLCAKSKSTGITNIGIELKCIVEQLKEQVQNVE